MDKIKIELSANQLGDLIYGLQKIQNKINEDRDIELTIDFNRGELYVKVLPISQEEFTMLF